MHSFNHIHTSQCQVKKTYPIANAGLQQQIPDQHPPPNIGPHPGRAPIKPDRLPYHILLLPPIPGAHQRHGQFPRFHPDQLFHPYGTRLWHQGIRRSADGNNVALPRQVRNGAVIPYVMQTSRGDEFMLFQDAQRRLDVEGMTSRETNELAVTGYPFVRGGDVAMIGVGSEIESRRGGGYGGGRWGFAVFGYGGDGDGGGVGAVEFEAGGVGGGDGGEVGDGRGGLHGRGGGGRGLGFFRLLRCHLGAV